MQGGIQLQKTLPPDLMGNKGICMFRADLDEFVYLNLPVTFIIVTVGSPEFPNC